MKDRLLDHLFVRLNSDEPEDVINRLFLYRETERRKRWLRKLLSRYRNIPGLMGTAAYYGRWQYIGIIKRYGGKINTRAGNFSPLKQAISRHKNITAKYLIELGADVNHLGPNFSTLEEAVRRNNRDGLILLLENGADPNLASPLHRAIVAGHIDMVRLLCQFGADPNKPDTLFVPRWPLEHCLNIRDEPIRSKMAKILIEYGADLPLTWGRDKEDISIPPYIEALIWRKKIIMLWDRVFPNKLFDAGIWRQISRYWRSNC